ncbi:hypothetical protein [Flavobacterium rhizosphaerae]|uniref:DUF4468 domain-containing protein n=1 Tax=Flavobacterium rhizosphaerae TaxID=3163298 RepID=A0ABW8YYG5_9FLAO
MKQNLLKQFLFVTFMLCAVVNQAAAQNINTNPYWAGSIKLVDSTIKEGYVMVPNSSKENFIAFKPTQKGKKETVNRSDIETVTVTSEQGHTYHYENIPAVPTIKGNASLGKSLLLIAGRNNYVTFYVESQKYRVNSETGEIYLFYRYVQGRDLPTTAYYIRKKGAEKANMLYITGHLGGIKKGVTYHLTEDPELVERVKNKELKGEEDIPEIISTYLKTTENLTPKDQTKG